MSHEREIVLGNTKKVTLDLEGGTVSPASDPELTLSRYPVRGLTQGELAILVTRTAAPAIVAVKVSNDGTDLRAEELEQIRKAAEGIFRGQFG